MSRLKNKIQILSGSGYGFSRVRFEDFVTCCNALNANAEVLKEVVARLEKLEEIQESRKNENS